MHAENFNRSIGSKIADQYDQIMDPSSCASHIQTPFARSTPNHRLTTQFDRTSGLSNPR